MDTEAIFRKLIELTAKTIYPDELPWRVMAEELAAASGLPIVAIALRDKETRTLKYKGAAGIAMESLSAGAKADGPGLSELAIRVGKPLALSNADGLAGSPECSEHDDWPCRMPLRTFVAVPLAGRGDPIGILSFASPWYVNVESSFIGGFSLIGSFLAFLIEHQDVERELRESEERLRSFFESAANGIYECDIEGRITHTNEAYARITGYTKDEILRMRIWDLHCPGPQKDALPGYLQYLVREQPPPNPYIGKNRNKDGKIIDVQVDWNYKRDSSGKLRGFACVISDITARKQAEEALAESERTFRSLFEATVEGITLNELVYDSSGKAADYRILDVNPAFERQCGIPPGKARGVLASQVYGPAGLLYLDEWKKVAETGVPSTLETRFPESQQYFRTSAFSLRKGCFAIVFEDITERKRQEHEHLELVAKAQRAREEAERANRTKDLFLATLSHELRTPLTAILTWSQMLRSGKLSPQKVEKGLETIEQSARMQTQLIKDLLDISSISAGKVVLDLQEVDPAAVISAVINSLRGEAEAKRLNLQFSYDSSVRTLPVDVPRFQQVLWNLIGNAIKFTPAGGRIEIRLEARGADCAEIAIHDTGKGIAPEFLPHLFERFSQADSTSTRSYAGLGLGLAIAKSLSELMGGSIRAESPGANQGATFIITLPRVSKSTKARREPRGGIQTTDAGLLRGRKVLLVDDEAGTREAVSTLLESWGTIVRTAASAREALALVAKFRPDVILSDIAMPGEDGYDLLRKLRELPLAEGRDVPAIAFTAYAGEENSNRAITSGFRAYVSKPVEATDLLRNLLQILGQDAGRTMATGQRAA